MERERNYMVLTAVGPDRPGLVNEISSLIRDAGANLEDSRMAILGGEFAIILLISGSQQATERVVQLGARIENELGLRCILKETSVLAPPAECVPYHIRVTGMDRPGIVHAITSVLARHGVNLATVESRVTYAPETGTPMFVLDADLQVPKGLDLSGLRADLAARCEEENLDFTLDGSA
jgi:glycine cleavage system transcriptional repressor